MVANSPHAAVIIPHFNDAVRLKRCLDALMPQIDPNTDVVVVDNGSDPSPEAMVASHDPKVRLLYETRKGAAHSRNRGVAETSASRIFFLDCDCVPSSDWLATAYEVAKQADLVGGQVTVFAETPPPRSGAEAFETVFAFDNRTYVQSKGFSVTANLLTTRVVFDRIGGFTPGLSEDLDWCRRATAAGFELAYEARLKVSHPARADWPALSRKWRRLTDESWALEDRGMTDRLRWGLRALAMLPSVCWHMPRVVQHPALEGGGERIRAALTLAKLRSQRCLWMLCQSTRR